MQPPNQVSRINLDELKAQLLKKVGSKGFKQYFYYLQRFLSLKLSKVELNKQCLRVLGRENIPLHNQLIRSILRNACCAKSPPNKGDGLKSEVPSDGYLQNGCHISMAPSSGLSNVGDVLPVSPRKARSGRERRSGARPSALGPNGNTSFPPQPIFENGGLNSHDIAMGPQMVDQSENVVAHTAKMAPLVHSKDQTELLVRKDGTRSPLRAPLGVPLCPVSIGGALRSSSSRYSGTFGDGALLDSNALRYQMEDIAVSQGLEGVSDECSNILNHGLDSYLKGIIRSCIDLNNNKRRSCLKLVNDISSGAHQYQKPEQRIVPPISLQDFRVAMELNPQQRGEDWPLLMERICTHAFEE